MAHAVAINEFVGTITSSPIPISEALNKISKPSWQFDTPIALSDPMGSSLYSYITNKKLESSGSSITEGIGTGRITKNFDKAIIDDAFQTDDTEALKIVYDLIEKQNIMNFLKLNLLRNRNFIGIL